jgi:predicted 3-demethylubiquinone-9 3-methyltransferase (glyoxalase superfamily)
MQQIVTFLMFTGNAGEAIHFYTSLFPNSGIISMERYGPEGPGEEGTVIHARFYLNGQEFMAIDSAGEHGFSFTPSISLYVNCGSEEEITRLYEKLSDNGGVLMPLDKYPFGEKFGWVTDRFGISWQLNLLPQ